MAEGSWFFITINCLPPGKDQFCRTDAGDAVLAAMKFNHERLVWHCRLCLLMPDHPHAIIGFPREPGMQTTVKNWKKYVAGKHGVNWQRDFFDHRFGSNRQLDMRDECQMRIHQLKAVGGLRAIYSCFADALGVGAALAPAAVLVPLAGSGFMAAGVGDADLFGLNKRGNLNLRGVGEGIGVGVGVGDASAVAFLRVRFGLGEAAGDSASEADLVLAAGEVVSVVFWVRDFGGEGDSLGGVPVSSCD